jgi:hypothetical protein
MHRNVTAIYGPSIAVGNFLCVCLSNPRFLIILPAAICPKRDQALFWWFRKSSGARLQCADPFGRMGCRGDLNFCHRLAGKILNHAQTRQRFLAKRAGKPLH